MNHAPETRSGREDDSPGHTSRDPAPSKNASLFTTQFPHCSGSGRRRELSPWSEFLSTLCGAQRHHRLLTMGEYAELVRQRATQAATPALSAHERNRDRRTRVLAHPDLVERLTAVLGLSAAEWWNGHVPPATDAFGNPNGSPVRAALVEISAEALRRQQAQEAKRS